MLYEKWISFYTLLSWSLNKIINVFTFKEGLIHAITEIVLRSRSRKGRLNFYDLLSRDLVKAGAQISDVENDLELRRPLNDSQTDNVLVFGVNSKKDRLVASISVNAKNMSTCWLYLRLSATGKSYSLPSESPTNVPKVWQDTFVSGGLRIRCLVPMRKWRISYNGVLMESGSTQERVHVKLAFTWTSSSYAHDLKCDISPTLKADYISSQRIGFLSTSGFKKLEEHLESYLQAGDMVGTVCINSGEERVVQLWGARKRNLETNNASSPDHFELIGYTKEGQMFNAGSLKFPNLASELKYGFVVLRSSYEEVMDTCTITSKLNHANSSLNVHKITLKNDDYKFLLYLGSPTEIFSFSTIGKKQVTDSFILPIALEDDQGQAILLNYSKTNEPAGIRKLPIASLPLPIPLSGIKRSNALVVKLGEKPALLTELVGGKGSSLGHLTHLKSLLKTSFLVPKGVVVTSFAYEEFLLHNNLHEKIKLLENVAWGKMPTEALEESCRRLLGYIANQTLPGQVKLAIEKKLIVEFGAGYKPLNFAIRSSASGEDSEYLSAAGQMTTYLGVSGIENIYEAVVSCWASQFSLTAVQYKRQNGQLLNSPMAVVIQEMVPADVAGVMFTCNPVTGDPMSLTITSNFGIGESVVSATAEPDTLIFNRERDNTLTVQSIDIGGKSTRTVMKESGEVVDEAIEDQSCKICSLSVTVAMEIAKIGVQIEEVYGCPMDIEWAVKDDRIHLLQARPVTTLDQENVFELTNELNSCLRCEDEYMTRANTGEVAPSAMTPSCSTFFNFISCVSERYFNKNNKQAFNIGPFTDTLFPIHQWYIFISMPNMILRFFDKNEKSMIAESSMMSAFGRLIDDPDMLNQAHKRKKYYKTGSNLEIGLHILYDVLMTGSVCRKAYDHLQKSISSWESALQEEMGAEEMFHCNIQRFFNDLEIGVNHISASSASSLANSITLGILAKEAGGWNDSVFSDFSLIARTSTEVESADVPKSMEMLMYSISKNSEKQKFAKMKKEEALDWLMKSKSEVGKNFRTFLDRHGHRGEMEFELISSSWSENPSNLVEKLQEVASVNLEPVKPKATPGVGETINKLTVPLSWKTRMFLRFLIPLCRTHVANREKSKSYYVKIVEQFRRGTRKLASQMVVEGFLPEEDLHYFLTDYEVTQLFKTRSPRLVQKAIKRKALYPKLVHLNYPEFVKSLATPIPEKTNNVNLIPIDTLKGTPVSQGVVKGRAIVAVNLQEAKKIQKGDILVTRGTDIGWSPYFPLLSGVATELGGLVSHGAVVAREYGLPCVVGLQGAVEQIKSGEMILLDGNRGILQRLTKEL